MGMTIEEVLKIIKDGRIVATIIKGNNEDDTKFNQENIEALNMIVYIMRKYQKIQQILESLDDGEINYPQMTYYLREVLEDGNND